MKTFIDGLHAEKNSSYAVKILNEPRSIRKEKINIPFASHIKNKLQSFYNTKTDIANEKE